MKRFKKILASKKILTWLILSLFIVGTSYFAMAEKRSGKGYLGVSIDRLSQHEKKELGVTFGVIVSRVVKGEAADKGGIEEDDVIQYFNDEKIRRPDDLIDAVRDTKPKTQAKIKLVRDGKSKEVTVTLGKLKSRFKLFGSRGGKGMYIFSGRGGYLGIHLQTLNKDLGEYFGVKEDGGALILRVEEDTPAEEVGLKAGDVIVKIDDEKISAPEDVTEILSDLEEGDKIEVQIVRHKKKKTMKVELDERAGSRRIDIFKFKGLVDKINFEIPHIHFNIPDFKECEFPWNDSD